MIRAEDIHFNYANHTVSSLQGVTLAVEAGEVVVICGKSGSGKSTFVQLLNGVIPTLIPGDLKGTIETADRIAGQSPLNDYVAVVGSVFQNPKTQHFAVTVEHELAFPCENMGMDPAVIQTRIQQQAERYGIISLLKQSLFELSGGQQQLVAFVTATMLEPAVLVLDEVTANLDEKTITQLTDMIQILKSQGTTIVIAEHRLAWTLSFADRYLIFHEGKVTQTLSPSQIIQLDIEARRKLGLRALDLTPYNARIDQMLQADLHSENKEEAASIKRLELSHADIGYQNQVQRTVDLTIRSGEVLAIMGANGTGKSTFAKTLVGLQEFIAGEIRWNGKPMAAKDRLKQSFLVMQDVQYQLFGVTVEEELLLKAKYPERKEAVVASLNLSHLLKRHPRTLSGGEIQRVLIGAALLSGKECLIFDEPTSGMDSDHMERFGAFIQQLKKENVMIIVITHDQELVADWCDRVIIFDEL